MVKLYVQGGPSRECDFVLLYSDNIGLRSTLIVGSLFSGGGFSQDGQECAHESRLLYYIIIKPLKFASFSCSKTEEFV